MTPASDDPSCQRARAHFELAQADRLVCDSRDAISALEQKC